MSDLTQRMLHIRQIPVGATLPPQVVRVIAAHLRERTFAPGQRLMRKGEPIDGLHMLLHGGVKLSSDGEALGDLDAPQTLGFLGILARLDGPYDAIAKGDVVVYELETDTLIELLEDHFELFSATLRYLAERTSADLSELPQEALGMPSIEMGPVPDRAMDVIERVMFLRKSSGLAQASINALAVMSRQMEEQRVKAGTRFWDVGDPAEHALFIVKGTVLCETADGRTFRYGPGVGAGGMEALAELPRWYSITAETDLVGLVGRNDHLLDLFENNHRMGLDFVAMLAKAQIGLLARRAAMGHKAQPARDLTKLRGVRVGA